MRMNFLSMATKKNRITSLAYFGGKKSRNKNYWINSVIGFDSSCAYVEPFAGMLGILISRKPVSLEIVNDSNQYLINWWRMVRDRHVDLGKLTENTPWSRDCLIEAIDKLSKEKDDLYQALWFHVLVEQSIQHTYNVRPCDFGLTYTTDGGSKKWRADNFIALSDRMKNVDIRNNGADIILEEMINIEKSMIYCDPPYLTSTISHYGEFGNFDKDKYTELFLAQKGDVAISGYRDEWDCLGWVKSEKKVMFNAFSKPDVDAIEKTEVIWSNFEPRNNKIIGNDEFFDF